MLSNQSSKTRCTLTISKIMMKNLLVWWSTTTMMMLLSEVIAIDSTTSTKKHDNNNDNSNMNMNGNYILSSTPNGYNTQQLFPTQYQNYPDPSNGNGGHVEYFDIYSPIISHLYSQVFWKGLPPINVPQHIQTKYNNAIMAIVGYEVDQVMTINNESGEEKEISVPINAVYNHHYETTMIGGSTTKFELISPHDPKFIQYIKNKQNNQIINGHGYPSNQPQWIVVDTHNNDMMTTDEFVNDITKSKVSEYTTHDFGGANGGEFRQSFHGYAPGYAQLIYSPKQFQITPMQIDTWHRTKMPFSQNGTSSIPKFVSGPLPQNSIAPTNATYSGLLECPVTTRLHRIVDNDNKSYIPLQGHDYCPTKANDSSSSTSDEAEKCFESVATILKSNYDHHKKNKMKFVNKTVSTIHAPLGCSARILKSTSSLSESTTVVQILYNTHHNDDKHETKAISCVGGDVHENNNNNDMIMVGAMYSNTSQVQLTVEINNNNNNLVTLTLEGPTDVWFGVGFGAQTMNDQPWTIIVEPGQDDIGKSTVTERHLQSHNPGTLVQHPTLTIVSNTVIGTRRTIIATRPLQGGIYNFGTNVTVLPLITAVGSTPNLSFHRSKDSTTMIMLPVVTQQNQDDINSKDTPGTCFCPTPPPSFGQATGSLEYHPVSNQKGEAGAPDKVRFNNVCKPQPRSDLLAQHNPTCDIRTYTGGQSACHHMWSLLDADQDIPWPDQPIQYRLKFRFWVQPYNDTYHRNVYRTTWGIASPTEYDVPKCDVNVPGCSQDSDGKWIHTIRGTFAVGNQSAGPLVAAHFHCHAPTCRSVALYLCPLGENNCNDRKGQLLCRELPVAGGRKSGKEKANQTSTARFDEPDFIFQPPCLWGSPEYGLEPPVDVRGRTLHAVKTADATYGHHGEMAWLQMYYIKN